MVLWIVLGEVTQARAAAQQASGPAQAGQADAKLGSALNRLFDTHPPLEDRIHALEESGGFELPPVS